jgi:hypothetical protein
MTSKERNRVAVVRLAPGVHLDGGRENAATLVLVCPDGNVQLNRIAAAILSLCDGSRNRKDVIAEVLSSSPKQARATEIVEFLDVAVARGWITEA